MIYDNVMDEKIRTQHQKAKTDQQIAKEKLTINRRDVQQAEDVEKARKEKQQEIGRIVIEEMPREVMIRGDGHSKEDLTVIRHDVVTKRNINDDKDQLLFGNELKKTDVDSKTVTERVATYKGRVKEAREVNVLKI